MARKFKTEKLPPFTPLIHQTMDTLAWRALTPAAKALYPLLKRKVGGNTGLNGQIGLGVREAAEYLGTNKDTAARAFHDLEAKGFIVACKVGHLGYAGHGKATEWRLTELGTGAKLNEGGKRTADFRSWQPGRDFPVGRGTTAGRNAKACREIGTGKAPNVPDIRQACPEFSDVLSNISDVLGRKREAPCLKSGTHIESTRMDGASASSASSSSSTAQRQSRGGTSACLGEPRTFAVLRSGSLVRVGVRTVHRAPGGLV